MTGHLGSTAGAYFLVVDDGDHFLVVGVLVATDHAWVVGRWDTREAAETIVAEWTALDAVAA